MTSDHAGLVRQIIMIPLTTLYRAPSHLETKEQGRVYLEQLVNAVASMRPAQFELEEAWNRVVREHKTTVWPTPAEICAALNDHRAKVSAAKKRAEADKPLPPPERDDGRFDPAAEARALAALDDMERTPGMASTAAMLRGIHARWAA